MTAENLALIIQEQGPAILERLNGELRTNLGTSHYHRLSNEELMRRGQAILTQLSDWLTTRSAGAVHRCGVELGRKRYAEGIPLGQVVLALILGEKQIWDYANTIGATPDKELRSTVAEFFARMIYSTALGFEEALTESTKKAPSSRTPSKVAEAPKADETQEMPASRAGQVGEVGG